MSSNCIFCKIINREIPAKLVRETPQLIAIEDINPKAPTHLLVIPKQHFDNIQGVQDQSLLGALFQGASEMAESLKLNRGFRLIINTGPDGGQTVDHLHIHLLAGRSLGWPPG